MLFIISIIIFIHTYSWSAVIDKIEFLEINILYVTCICCVFKKIKSRTVKTFLIYAILSAKELIIDRYLRVITEKLYTILYH